MSSAPPGWEHFTEKELDEIRARVAAAEPPREEQE